MMMILSWLQKRSGKTISRFCYFRLCLVLVFLCLRFIIPDILQVAASAQKQAILCRNFKVDFQFLDISFSFNLVFLFRVP